VSSSPGIAWHELLTRAAAEAGAGRIDDAIATYRSVLELSPTLAEAHHNCGALLFARGDFDAAARSFDEAAKHKPAWPAPLLALGHVHFHTGRYADAQQAFERALALDANSIEALGNLGLTLQRRSRWSVALAHLQRARALAPTDVRVWFALRTTLLLLGRVEEAVEDFLRFEPGAPLSAELVTTGLMFSRFIGDPAYEAKYLPHALEWPYRSDQADLAAVTVSRAQYCDLPRETLLELYRKYDRLQQQNRSRFEPIALTRRAALAASGRMRIGYLSADFRAHVMGRLMREVLAAHDSTRVSLYLYSLAPEANEDQLTSEFRGLCERFVNLAERDDHSAALAIAGDEVDVLVDLMGHSSFSRPGILLWKPAPVIITHLGYHGCVGLREIDFKLTDAFADLPDAGSFQIEAPLALDCCLLPVRRVSPALSPASAPAARRAELGIADSAILFGAFVSLLKLSPRCLNLWRDILQRVPQSLLAFSPGNASEQSLYRRRVARGTHSPGRGDQPRSVVLPCLRTRKRPGADDSRLALLVRRGTGAGPHVVDRAARRGTPGSR